MPNRIVVLVLAALLASGCNVAITPQTSTTPARTGVNPSDTSTPASVDPGSTGALPAPSLGTTQQIAAAMSTPDHADEVVAAMLDALGIGLYRADGTPIRTGAEAADTGFFVFEIEALGLANLLRERDDPDRSVSFVEFHAALAKLGYEGSVEDLARAYTESFASDPDAAISSFIRAVTTIDPNGRISRFAAWLLVLDGFIPARPATSAVALAAFRGGGVAAGGAGWGMSYSRIQAHSRLPADQARLVNRLAAIAAGYELAVEVANDSAHEGHSGPGEPVTVVAELNVSLITFTSPVDHEPVIPVVSSGDLAGIAIGFEPDEAADRHLSTTGGTAFADTGGTGIASRTWTMKPEDSRGQGPLQAERVSIVASAVAAQVLRAVYGEWVDDYSLFIDGDILGRARFSAEWHGETTPIQIWWTDTFDGNDDTIYFRGDLTAIDTSIPGSVAYVGTGLATGTRDGWKACNPGIDDVPEGTVNATFMAGVQDGQLTIAAFPDATTSLAGIFAGPFVVPLDEIDDYEWDLDPSPLLGEVCPHNSRATIRIKGLALPAR